MSECSDESDEYVIEINQAESRRRREERKRAKMLLIESGCSPIELTNEDTINAIINQSKIKQNRRKHRLKKPVSFEVDGECSTNFKLGVNDCVSTSNNLRDITKNLKSLNVHEPGNKHGCVDVVTTNAKKTSNKKEKIKKKTLTDMSINTGNNSKSSGNFIKSMYFRSSPRKEVTNDHKQKLSMNDQIENKRKNKNVEQNSPIKEELDKEQYKFGNYIPLKEVQNDLDKGNLFSGILRINAKDYKLSYIKNPLKSEQDFLIVSIKDRNGALEGDNVVVKLKPETEWKNKQKTGMVVYILEQIHPRTAIGNLKLMPDRNKRFALFVPRDCRVPRIKIPFTDWPVRFYEEADKYEDVLFKAKITKWIEPKYAVGTIIEHVGVSGDIKAETLAILAENCLNMEPYSEEMQESFPASIVISPEEYKNRSDLRKDCIFTIDPATARDLDDAVSCRELPNGNFEIGVHIADVTYYLKDDTPLDEMVAEKATSIYMVESVYHMLPRNLCIICSLLPGEDKLAFSVIWEITPTGEVLSHKICRTVINSCVQLSYEHAQLMIENPDKNFTESELPEIYNGYKPADLNRIVNSLNKLAVIFREARFQNGALRIDQPKVQFSLDFKTCLPVSYSIYENKACHRLIEEFMLLANITVATQIHKDYPNLAFLRSHAAPHEYMMSKLKSNLETVGVYLDVTSSGNLQQSLWKYSGDDIISQARMLVLNILCAKPMTRANYFCANNSKTLESYWHYALSVPLYTHFTSPIRRYADIVVHRQLAGSLGYREKPNWTEEYVSQIAANCNKQKFNAKRAGEQSIELYLIQYIAQNQPVIEKAVVMSLKNKTIDAIVIRNGLNVRIYLNNLEEDIKHYFSEDAICENATKSSENNEEDKSFSNLNLEWPAKDGKPFMKQIIAMFSLITVSLSKRDKLIKLDSKLVRPDTTTTIY